MNSQAAVNATLRSKINTVPQPEVHRFIPGENPRSIVSAKAPSASKLAGEVSFDPVATISGGSGNTFVRPVKNTSSRAVSAAVLNKDGQVSIRGERLIELSGSLHEQIRAKVNQGVAYQKETLTKPSTPIVPVANPAVVSQTPQPNPTPAQNQARTEDLKKQLENINKALFEQIQKKISQELSRQTQPTQLASNELKNPAFKAPKPVSGATLSNNQIKPPPVTPPTQQTPLQPRENLIKAAPQTPLVGTSPQPASSPGAVVPKSSPAVSVSPTQPLAPPTSTIIDKQELTQHISNLEQEIETLTKEVTHIDQTISSLESERNLSELTALEQKIDYDSRMMQAVTDWKFSLTNLVNSHSIALKYLKQKTDWLEDKVENIEGHRAKHEKTHRKPREISLKLEPLPKETKQEKGLPLASAQPKIPVRSDFQINLPNSMATAGSTTIESSLTQPAPVKEIAHKEEINEAKLEKAVDKAVEQKEKEQQPKVSESEALAENLVSKKVADLVKQELDKQTALTEAKSVPTEVGPNTPTQSVEASTNVPIGQPKVPVGIPEAKSDIKATPTETGFTPKENLPPTTATLSTQSDIERQILEAAEREDATREAVQKAKEEMQRQQHAQAEKSQAQEPHTKPASESVPDETLKGAITQLKSSLTTTDNKSLEKLSVEERRQMLTRLTSLEHQSEVSRQFDEIRGAAERRRVNAELQAMLQKLGEKPATPSTAPTVATSTPPASTQVEALKVAEKKEKSPEEKAKIIAEIKALEREREARKLEERSRPVVKAQPAYGKMLPNTPTIPNVINGLVKDVKGLLMDTVVIIVKDHNGDPVRAFKTNKIGQFAVSTPLPNGTYILELEKPGFDFDIIEVEVNGGILPPIEIKARG